MDELTLLRSAREDIEVPQAALNRGRAALLERTADAAGPASAQSPRRRGAARRLRRATWIATGAAAALVGALIVGNISLDASSAHASDLLRSAAAATVQYVDLAPGSGQYLRAHTHAQWQACDEQGCTPNVQSIDVYMPADPDVAWVLVRDWGAMSGVTGSSVETIREPGGRFYGQDSSWIGAGLDYADIPTDGAAAYAWIDAQYTGGSASRDEDDFVRITDILRTGLVPAPQRAALLDALSRVPGVSATEGVANFDGVIGVAIGRAEPVRAGERQEIIIDPLTGLVIGERMIGGGGVFGWNFGDVVSLTAVESSIVDTAP
ncbi:MAG: hypothetical protein J0I43_00375 [Microbacterium sp.]|uniref:hypothetical protein n=1 Tax=Microbacterium sp. TaxID=51671 RepID=UPI001ACDD66C|nr:hypothetical protein [Microbacterium sp.]MBN9175815.1 hypothetical protein [Microbacterium sp.]